MKIRLPISFVSTPGVGEEIKTVVFYRIDNIRRYIHNKKNYTIVSSGGEEFVCVIKLEEVENQIDKKIREDIVVRR